MMLEATWNTDREFLSVWGLLLDVMMYLGFHQEGGIIINGV